MNMCELHERAPSMQRLRAFAVGELHGDGAGELAAHIEHCESCTKRLRALQVVERCDRAILAADTVSAVAAEGRELIAAAWRKVADGLLELPRILVLSLQNQRDLIVQWADGAAVVTSTPALQLLASAKNRQVAKQIDILESAGGVPCSVNIIRDAQGAIRLEVDFGEYTARGRGILQVELYHDTELKESHTIANVSSVGANVSSVGFDTILFPGDYVVELRGKIHKHRIPLTVD